MFIFERFALFDNHFSQIVNDWVLTFFIAVYGEYEIIFKSMKNIIYEGENISKKYIIF